MFGSSTKHVKDQSLAMRRRISTEHVQYLLRTASKQEEKNRYLASVGSPRCEIGSSGLLQSHGWWEVAAAILVGDGGVVSEFGRDGAGSSSWEVWAGLDRGARWLRDLAPGARRRRRLVRRRWSFSTGDRRSRSEAAAFCRWGNPPNRAMDSGGLGMEKKRFV
jgi:hypothetical protein